MILVAVLLPLGGCMQTTLSPSDDASLTPRDRQLLWLAHAENYSHREIAEITGLAVTSIRLLLFRARREMAHLLEQKGGGLR